MPPPPRRPSAPTRTGTARMTRTRPPPAPTPARPRSRRRYCPAPPTRARCSPTPPRWPRRARRPARRRPTRRARRRRRRSSRRRCSGPRRSRPRRRPATRVTRCCSRCAMTPSSAHRSAAAGPPSRRIAKQVQTTATTIIIKLIIIIIIIMFRKRRRMLSSRSRTTRRCVLVCVNKERQEQRQHQHSYHHDHQHEQNAFQTPPLFLGLSLLCALSSSLLLSACLYLFAFFLRCLSHTRSLPSPSIPFLSYIYVCIYIYKSCTVYGGGMIKGVFIINTAGKIRLSVFFEQLPLSLAQQLQLLHALHLLVAPRGDDLCHFVEHFTEWPTPDTRVIYRRYATLRFFFLTDSSESHLAILDLMQVYVEVLDRLFESVCELDLVFHAEKARQALQEMLMGGGLVLETGRSEIMKHLDAMQQLTTQQRQGAGFLGGPASGGAADASSYRALGRGGGAPVAAAAGRPSGAGGEGRMGSRLRVLKMMGSHERVGVGVAEVYLYKKNTYICICVYALRLLPSRLS
ncbi:AP-3 complex subunit sigma [Strigomonas culicis]|uniref:AP-3 complex subunit sigma n=1 Tax=Strigomonas culicis TaxID=28005 RepID=S9UQT3_9TRYP|nr:AP-3 complex subunit sigma [Strigomonas culicis]|eukprot:EPY31228.1 AP-3 complex subunit sigma [Strigomonas culicis]